MRLVKTVDVRRWVLNAEDGGRLPADQRADQRHKELVVGGYLESADGRLLLKQLPTDAWDARPIDVQNRD
jgi:hypothetical protein